MFILSAQRDSDLTGNWWHQYQAYLASEKDRFPPSAFALATSDWFHSGHDPRAPHDAWLRRVTVRERSSDDESQYTSTSIEIELLGAHHDGLITLTYPVVHEYRLEAIGVPGGLGDWRYDELRLDERGRPVHEIEWWSTEGTNTWKIAASDLRHAWTPTTMSS